MISGYQNFMSCQGSNLLAPDPLDRGFGLLTRIRGKTRTQGPVLYAQYL